MEKKKMKLWKKVLIVIAIILLIFIILTLRKTIILSDIDNKVTNLENRNKNIYAETTIETNSYTTKLKRYIKDDIDKLVLEKTDENGEKTKIIQITYPNQRKIFTEKDNFKVMNIYDEVAPIRGSHIENTTTSSYTTIINFAYSISIPEQILNSILTTINSTEIDGKECYELSSKYNTNFIYSQNGKQMKAYVEKETGLPVKLVEVIEENGKKSENITNYEYKFDCVTDEDIKEPDISQYKMQEN